MKRWKWILFIAAIVAIILSLFFYTSFFYVSFKPSEVYPDFPIPVHSKMVEKPHANKGWTFYEISPSLTGMQFDRYLQEIEEWGWDEQEREQMGRLRVFEKDGKIMAVVLYGDKMSLCQSSK